MVEPANRFEYLSTTRRIGWCEFLQERGQRISRNVGMVCARASLPSQLTTVGHYVAWWWPRERREKKTWYTHLDHGRNAIVGARGEDIHRIRDRVSRDSAVVGPSRAVNVSTRSWDTRDARVSCSSQSQRKHPDATAIGAGKTECEYERENDHAWSNTKSLRLSNWSKMHSCLAYCRSNPWPGPCCSRTSV